jgi:hypothetical protein
MPIAAVVYERLRERQKEHGFGKPDGFVFFPQYTN